MAAVQTTMFQSPAIYNDSIPVELPTCMYTVNSYHEMTKTSGSDCLGESCLQVIANKQENIFKDLEQLRGEVNSLASKLGVKLREKRLAVTVDYVVSASPQDPPLSLFFLQQVLNQRNMVHSTSVFVHSSAVNTDLSKVPSLLKSTNDQGRRSPCLLTVIWKNVPDLPVLVTSSNHTPLVGEFTIARHLCRTLLPDLYSKLSLDDIAQIDQWICLATQSIISGKPKERATALHNLSSHLASYKWLVGNQISLADITVASAVIKTHAAISAPANVKNWLKNFPVQQ